jgi:hypothetical protein
MRERQPSIADALMNGQTLLDGRYRLDALVRRSATATIHVATHRNGSTAWLKLPVSRNVQGQAEMLAREASVTSTIGSPLVVRDDGTTRDGVPYLVLDPPAAESLATLRTRARTGARLPLAHVMTVGDALARVAASLHALGYGLGSLEDEDVLVFANGDVALLDLHALTPATRAGIATDVRQLVRVLTALVTDVADSNVSPSTRAAIGGALAASYPDVAALQAAWRAAAPEPIALPARLRMGSLADVSATLPAAPVSAQPAGLSSHGGPPPKDPDGSVIGYLRSGMISAPPPAPPLAPHERPLMYDPLSRMQEMPRLVASLRPPEKNTATSSRSMLLVAAVLVPPALAALIVALLFLSGSDARPEIPAPSASASIPTPTPTSTPTPTPIPTPSAAPATPDELQLETQLRTDGAPPDRDVFLDGKKVGKTPLSVLVPCGHHTLQMVAGAPLQSVELPCGGMRVIRYDAKGHWSLKAE